MTHLPFNRDLFFKVYFEMVLDDEVLNKLYTDPNNPLKDRNDEFKNITNSYLLRRKLISEIFESIEWARYLSKLMKDCNQTSVVTALEELEKGLFIEYKTDNLVIVSTKNPILGGYEMEKAPRGLCLIINNLIELEPQVRQIKSVFTQLYFTVKEETMKTAREIDLILKKVATHEEYSGQNSLFVYFMGHGNDEVFNGITYNKNILDNAPIKHLLDHFSQEKSPNFKYKPKVFIFDCCRIRTITNRDLSYSTLMRKIKNYSEDEFKARFKDTLIIYSTPEGHASWYLPEVGLTFFGRAFTHSIAQYACERSLIALIHTVKLRNL